MAGMNPPSSILCRRLYQQYFNSFHPQRWFASVPRRAKVVAAAGRGTKASEKAEDVPQQKVRACRSMLYKVDPKHGNFLIWKNYGKAWMTGGTVKLLHAIHDHIA